MNNLLALSTNIIKTPPKHRNPLAFSTSLPNALAKISVKHQTPGQGGEGIENRRNGPEENEVYLHASARHQAINIDSKRQVFNSKGQVLSFTAHLRHAMGHLNSISFPDPSYIVLP